MTLLGNIAQSEMSLIELCESVETIVFDAGIISVIIIWVLVVNVSIVCCDS